MTYIHYLPKPKSCGILIASLKCSYQSLAAFGFPRAQTVWFSHGECFCVLGGAVAL